MGKASGQARALRTVDDLRRVIDPDNRAALQEVAARYAVAITPAIADLIDRGDPHDPIARQFVPRCARARRAPEERADPIGDDAHSARSTASCIAIPTACCSSSSHVCAVYCRFCFRREMVGPAAGRRSSARGARRRARLYRARRPQIWEVILTGGDPLVLSRAPPARGDRGSSRRSSMSRSARAYARAGRRARRGSRRRWCARSRHRARPSYVVLHANHPRELTDAARAACAPHGRCRHPMLSQSVLLRGVNDDAETLAR